MPQESVMKLAPPPVDLLRKKNVLAGN